MLKPGAAVFLLLTALLSAAFSQNNSSTIERKFPKLERLSQINFLGPYDGAGRLVRLNCTDDAILSDELYTLIEDIKTIE